MEASKHQTRRSVQPIAPLVRGAIDTFAERYPDLPEVERRLDDDARAPVDADALVMAIDNLLENARKYAADGAPYEVDLEATNRMLRIAVRDRGPGIARRDQQRIFQPFERVDDRLSRATEGSGIGLSLVRHVARSHGGDARVESTPGQGATFIVTIAREEP
jgi:signal transduction histidine kinase